MNSQAESEPEPEPEPDLDADLAGVGSVVLRRLIAEVRNEALEDSPRGYNRTYNRYMGGGKYNRTYNRHNR